MIGEQCYKSGPKETSCVCYRACKGRYYEGQGNTEYESVTILTNDYDHLSGGPSYKGPLAVEKNRGAAFTKPPDQTAWDYYYDQAEFEDVNTIPPSKQHK